MINLKNLKKNLMNDLNNLLNNLINKTITNFLPMKLLAAVNPMTGGIAPTTAPTQVLAMCARFIGV